MIFLTESPYRGKTRNELYGWPWWHWHWGGYPQKLAFKINWAKFPTAWKANPFLFNPSLLDINPGPFYSVQFFHAHRSLNTASPTCFCHPSLVLEPKAIVSILHSHHSTPHLENPTRPHSHCTSPNLEPPAAVCHLNPITNPPTSESTGLVVDHNNFEMHDG